LVPDRERVLAHAEEIRMMKLAERDSPNSCFNKALETEYVFVLLARDAAAPVAIRAWITERVRLGLNAPGDAKLVAAEETAIRMTGQRVNGNFP
jgi:hypothetical protein